MTFFVALAAGVTLTIVSAQGPCPPTLISVATASPDAIACRSATGFLAGLSPPDPLMVATFCLNQSCQQLLQTVSAMVPTECIVGGTRIKATVLDEFQNCGVNASTAPISVVSACPSTLISVATSSPDAEACRSATGFSASSAIVSPPNPEMVARFCLNQDCQQLLQAVSAIIPTECVIGGIRIKENVLDKLQNCGVNASTARATTISPATATPTIGAPTAITPRSTVPAPFPGHSNTTTVVGILIGTAVVIAIIACAAFRCGRRFGMTRGAESSDVPEVLVVPIEAPPYYLAADTTPTSSDKSVPVPTGFTVNH